MKNHILPLFKILTLLLGLLLSVSLLIALMIGGIIWIHNGMNQPQTLPSNFLSKLQQSLAAPKIYKGVVPKEGLWQAPDWNLVAMESNAEEISYGKELIANTSAYLGPNGKVQQITNGMNCQNCHLAAGTLPLGNNYSAVASTYPKVRARSGQLEDMPKRINDCIERSLNGMALPDTSKEMKAIVAYMNWLGKDVPKGESPKGVGIYELPFLDRAADRLKGRVTYAQLCQSCHMEDGQGVKRPDNLGYVYPPLWGNNSYNEGAGLFRISRFAGYIKTNMPFGVTFEEPVLTDEQAWDLAAYVNSMARPKKDLTMDWPDIGKKPIDHPFGPFTDGFNEQQHKYGPFKPILAAKSTSKPK